MLVVVSGDPSIICSLVGIRNLRWRAALPACPILAPMRINSQLVMSISRLQVRVILPSGGDVVDLHEGGDHFIFTSDGRQGVVILHLLGILQQCVSERVYTMIADTSTIIMNKMGSNSVTEVSIKLVILNRAIGVEHQAMHCAVRYSRAHHRKQSSSWGAEYFAWCINLREIIFK